MKRLLESVSHMVKVFHMAYPQDQGYENDGHYDHLCVIP